MGARELLDALASSGMSVRLECAWLIISPRALLTDDMRTRLKAHRSELVPLLSEGGATQVAEPEAPDPHVDPVLHDDDAPERTCVASPAPWAKLLSLGLDAEHAQALSDWTRARDLEGDDRRLCAECFHFGQRGKVCRHPELVAIGAPRDLGQLATTPQRCSGFQQEGSDGW